MPVRAVVFDIGGVLEHTPSTGWPQRWATRLNVDLAVLESVAEEIWTPGEIGATSLGRIHIDTANALDVAPATMGAMFADVWEEYLGTANTALIDYVAGLRPRCRTALLSNSFVGAREREQARYGFNDIVDTVVYSHEEGMRKPDPRIYRVVCMRLGVAPEAAVFVDDVDECVAGAHAIGMHAIRHTDNQRTIAGIESHLTEHNAWR